MQHGSLDFDIVLQVLTVCHDVPFIEKYRHLHPKPTAIQFVKQQRVGRAVSSLILPHAVYQPLTIAIMVMLLDLVAYFN